MAENDELEKLKALIGSSGDNQDKDAILQNVLKFIEQSKDETGQNEEQLMHKLLADLRGLYRPQATYYEYLLFIGVTTFIISVFGERKRER